MRFKVKKLLCGLLSLLMVVSLCAVPSDEAKAANGEPNVSMSVSKDEVQVGDTFTATVSIAKDCKLNSLGAGIQYDNTMLECISMTGVNGEPADEIFIYRQGTTGTMPVSVSVAEISQENGRVAASFMGGKCVTYKEGGVFTATFKVLNAGNGETSLTLYEDSYGDTEDADTCKSDNVMTRVVKTPIHAETISIQDGKGEAVSSLSVKTGVSYAVTLKAVVTPNNATDAIEWTSSDTSIATVSNGKVIGVKEGSATITVKAGEKSASCTVYVSCSHTNTVERSKKEPTCVDAGYEAYQECKDCGEIVGSKTTIPATGKHTATAPATCVKKAVCSVCKQEFGEFGEHATVKVAAEPGTCVEKAVKEHYKCTVCEKKFTDAAGTKEATDADIYGELGPHSVNPVAEQPADCTNKGKKAHYACSVCKKLYADQEATKEVTVSDITVEALGHIGGTATDCKTKAVCTRCGSSYGDYGPHKFTVYPEKAATCTEKGNIEYRFCSTCTKYYDKNEKVIALADTIIKALGHSVKEVPAKAATCTEKGLKAYYVCQAKDCAKKFADKEATTEITDLSTLEVPSLGHSYTKWASDATHHWKACSRCNEAEEGTKAEHKEKTAATCTDFAVCEICGASYGSLAPHTIKAVEAVKAECGKAGNIAYFACEKCNKFFEDEAATKLIKDQSSVVLKALEHDYADATCTVAKTCKLCGKTEGEALGHSYTVEAYDEASHWMTCDRCKEKDEKSVKAHEYTTDTDETCNGCAYVREVTPVVVAEKKLEEYVVPKALVEKGIETVKQIQEKIVAAAISNPVVIGEKKLEFKSENTKVIDIDLTYKNAELKADEKYTIYIPYPQGTTAKTHTYRIIHMIDEGSKAGSIETFDEQSGNMTLTDKGIEITVTGASPFAITYAALAAEETVTKPETKPEDTETNNSVIEQNPVEQTPAVQQPVVDQSPKTEDVDNGYIWLLLAMFSALCGVLAVVCSRRKQNR